MFCARIQYKYNTAKTNYISTAFKISYKELKLMKLNALSICTMLHYPPLPPHLFSISLYTYFSDYMSAIHLLSNLTLLLQKSQTALYSTRRQILLQMDLLPWPNNITLRRPCPHDLGALELNTILGLEYPLLKRRTPAKETPPISRSMWFSPAMSSTKTDYTGISWYIPTEITWTLTSGANVLSPQTSTYQIPTETFKDPTEERPPNDPTQIK